jgi:hypothetical protein
MVAMQAGNNNYNSAESLINLWTIHGVPQVGSVSFEREEGCVYKVRSALLLANTTDPEGSALTLVGVSETSVAGYAVQVVGDWLYYSPPDDFAGNDSFTFEVRNAFGGESSGTATIVVSEDSGDGSVTLNVVSKTASDGNITVCIAGIPGRIYEVKATESLSEPEWVDVGQVEIGLLGYTTLIDSNAPPSRFYKTVQIEETP